LPGVTRTLPVETRLEALLTRARGLAVAGERRVLGITGAPGAGKSTLAVALAAELGESAALVGMDAFHLANSELERLGRRDRKGAIDTFDGAGYVALLERLATVGDEVVYAPEFRREIEEAIAGAVPVGPEVALVITEGNYLLVDSPPWSRVRPLLAEAWFCRPPEDLRIERLIERHVAFGKAPDFARSWVLGSDQRNARLVAPTAARADLVVELPWR
jgi:pantothenate kinase